MNLNGKYTGKDVFVQNPPPENGSLFCTQRVLVNGKEISFENESAFKIDLRSLNFKIGDSVNIVIIHRNNCRPKVIIDNSTPKSSFELSNMDVSDEGLLKWKTKNEIGKLPFIIEQYRYLEWVYVGEVDGKGDSTENSYEFQLKPNAGKNLVRIKQIDYSGRPRLSRPKEFISKMSEVTFTINEQSNVILFSRESWYRLYNENGVILKTGTAISIDCYNLPKGKYFLWYDNKAGDFKL